MISTCFLLLIIIVLIIIIFNNSSNKDDFACTGKNDSLDQKIWGPSAWLFLHTVAYAYPHNPTKDDKKSMKTFIESFRCILPCVICKKHFEENLKKIPLRLNSRAELFEWTIDLHNRVNEMLGKRPYSYEEVYAMHKNIYNK